MKYTVIFLSLLLVGCESSQDMFKTQNEEGQVVDSGIRCEMMARTGSNRKMKVCRTVEQIKKDEKTAYSSLNRKQRTGYTIPKEGGLPN